MKFLADGQVFDLEELSTRLSLTSDEVDLLKVVHEKQLTCRLLEYKSGKVWGIETLVDEYALPPIREKEPVLPATFE